MEESGLFQARFTEEGKKYIRKFAAISYTIIVLVFFECAIIIYWEIQTLSNWTNTETGVSNIGTTLYERIYPYISISLSILLVVSNLYYVRFPQALLRSLKVNDESGANQAFRLLFRGSIIFLLSLILSTISLIWSLTFR